MRRGLASTVGFSGPALPGRVERAERERKLAEAIHSGQLEGLRMTDATKTDADKYVTGEVDLVELEERVRARYGIA